MSKSQQQLFVTVFTTTGKNERKLASLGVDVVGKGSIEKATDAAVLALKKGRMQMTDKTGHMVSIMKPDASETVGFGITKEPVNAEWCQKNSSANYLLQLTPKEVTSKSAQNKKVKEGV